MLPSTIGFLTFHAFRWLGRGAIWLMIVVGVVTTFGGQWSWLQQRTEFAWLESNFRWLVAALAGAVAISHTVCRHIGEPRFWETIGRILTGFRNEVFGTDGVEDHDRITLYRFQRWRFHFWTIACRTPWWWPWGSSPRGNLNWPFSGWMVPVVRSGHLRQGKSVFLARSDQDSWGVAGTAYFRVEMLELPNLPALPARSPEVVIQYARETFATPEWIQQRLQADDNLARYFFAIRIPGGKSPWGVIMIDSRRPGLSRGKSQFRMLARIVGELVDAR